MTETRGRKVIQQGKDWKNEDRPEEGSGVFTSKGLSESDQLTLELGNDVRAAWPLPTQARVSVIELTPQRLGLRHSHNPQPSRRAPGCWLGSPHAVQ